MSDRVRMGGDIPLVYFGRERPAAREWGGRLPVALVVPGEPGHALSALGWQAVYRLAASDPGLAVERVFCREGVPPRAEDSGRPLADFPVVAFSLGFEEEYRLAAKMLLDSGIPLEAVRRPDFPIVAAGGPLSCINPAPFLPALDLLYVGEAEAGLPDVLSRLKDLALAGASKAECLAAVADLPGVLVPGTTKTPVRRAVALAAGSAPILLDPAFSCFVSPEAEFADMLLIEINRGCPYGCRFCAAGFVYRPPRAADLGAVKALIEAANPRKVGLVGTALTDWPGLLPLLDWLAERKTKPALSSVRADGITRELLSAMRRAGLRTLTLALEAPSERLRRAANKHLAVADLISAVALAGEYGVNHLKLYLIVGWPGETPADYAELSPLLAEIARAGKVGGGKKGIGHVTLSVTPLIPKPFTPLEWAPMADEAAIEAAVALVKETARGLKGFRVAAEAASRARVQGLLARGDERLFPLIEEAARLGSFRRALKSWDGDPGWYLDRERGEGEAFPWEIVDIGVSRDALRREWQRYHRGAATAKCPPAGCAACARCGPFGPPAVVPPDKAT